VRDRRARNFALMLRAHAVYPGAVGAAKVGLYYRFHSLSKRTLNFTYYNFTYSKRTHHPTRLPSDPVCLAA